MTRTRAAKLAAAVAAVAVTTACGGSAGGTTEAKSHATTATAHTVATTAPLKVVATYDAKSLGIKMAQALALGPDGNLYLTDLSQRVVVVSPAGKVLRAWGGPGTAPGKFRFVTNDPTDPTHVQARITVGPDGTVYVSDSGNQRVQAFSSGGKLLRSYGAGHGRVRFLAPFDLVADKNGNVYVTDDTALTLTKLNRSAQTLWHVGGYTATSPALIGHLHVQMIDTHGRLLVSNDDAARIAFVDTNGHVVDAFGDRQMLPNSSCDATVDASGQIWTAGCGSTAGVLIDRSHHREVAAWPTVDGHDMETAPRWASDGRGYFLTTNGTIVVVQATGR